ncbi:MAG TPA: hypothetical protein VEY09_06475 [Pyrinomonadaceae bacterium]|nr:hypothetical protein [Pyrinomonadaceae bacterium]
MVLTTLLLAGCGASGSDTAGGDSRRPMTEAETRRVEKAADEFHRRMNPGEYGQIWERRFAEALGSKEGFSGYLRSIHEKYGPVTHAELVKGEISPHLDEPRKLVADVWFKVKAAKGKYMEHVIWHFVGEEEKLAVHTLVQYDEQGRPYLIQTLSDPKSGGSRQHKIVIGEAEPSTK